MLNVLSSAMYSPPASAKMSKFESTVAPFKMTLNFRLPAAVQ